MVRADGIDAAGPTGELGRSVSSAWIDVDRSRGLATVWSRHADELVDLQFAVEADGRRLELGALVAPVARQLGGSASGLWIETAYLRAVADEAVRVDTAGEIAAVALGPCAITGLRIAAGHGAGERWASSRWGDVGGTNRREIREPFHPLGLTPEARGRSLVARALSDAGSATQIRGDEFELVRVSDRRFVVVLPGVVDLSSLDLGLADEHRSVRDLDQHAIPSSRSATLADNRYAAMIADALSVVGVPSGAELLIVGHSFGADTALDLAADATFNGPEGYQVTHVVAAGYYSDPQLPHVDPATLVLVLQNFRDAAVLTEAAGDSGVTDALAAVGGFFSDVWDRDPVGAWEHGVDAVDQGGEAAVHGGAYAFEHRDDLAAIAGGVVARDAGRVAAGAGDFVTRDQRVEQVAPNQLLDVFEGGASGWGHDPALYVERVLDVADPRIVEFWASLDAAGFTGPGTAWAIDVSVPR